MRLNILPGFWLSASIDTRDDAFVPKNAKAGHLFSNTGKMGSSGIFT